MLIAVPAVHGAREVGVTLTPDAVRQEAVSRLLYLG